MTIAQQDPRGPVTLPDLRAHADAIVSAALRHRGTGLVEVFGSVARGDSTTTSDLDLLVEFRSDASLFDLSALELELADLLGVKVDVMSRNAVGRAADHARSDAVAL